MSNENAPHDEQSRPAVGGPVQRMVRPADEAHQAPAVLDTTDSEVLREALAVAWGDSMTAQLKCNDQAAEIERLRAKLGQLVLPAIEAAVAAERERCARICDGIGAGYTGAARRLDGRHATHAAGQRDGSNECAAAIRRA